MARRPTSSQSRPPKATAVSAALASREVPQILNAVLDRLEEERKEESRLEAKRARAEGEMLAADLKRLIEKHGENHPRVRKTRMAQASMERQASFAEAIVQRMETLKPPAFGGWTATGRVWDENARPLAGAEVAFVPIEGSEAPALEPAKTDGEGEFYATYPPEIVRQLVEINAQLLLVIRKGRTVIYRDPTSFSIRPNAVRQFRVRLSEADRPPRKR